MNPVTKEDYLGVLEKIKKEQADFYQFLMSDLVRHENHHYYHTKLFDSFRIGLETGILDRKYEKEFEVVKSIRSKFIYHELFGNWVGTEKETIRITLALQSPDTFKLVRRWEEVVDNEVSEEIQEYQNFDIMLVESDGLIILNLSSDEKRCTTLKVVLHPEICFKKSLVGSVFMFSDSTFLGCNKIILEKVESES